MELIAELKELLAQSAPEDVWRPVYGTDQSLLMDGYNDMREATPDEFRRVDFRGKSVLDVGCNFGFYSFLARDLGARHVVGMDIDPCAIRGSEILKKINGYSGIDFRVGDYTALDSSETFDIGMLICFLGKGFIYEGLRKYLDAIQRVTRETMIISIRPFYYIDKKLRGDYGRLQQLYGPEYIRKNIFLLREYVRDFFREGWDNRVIGCDHDDEAVKITHMFTRK